MLSNFKLLLFFLRQTHVKLKKYCCSKNYFKMMHRTPVQGQPIFLLLFIETFSLISSNVYMLLVLRLPFWKKVNAHNFFFDRENIWLTFFRDVQVSKTAIASGTSWLRQERWYELWIATWVLHNHHHYLLFFIVEHLLAFALFVSACASCLWHRIRSHIVYGKWNKQLVQCIRSNLFSFYYIWERYTHLTKWQPF